MGRGGKGETFLSCLLSRMRVDGKEYNVELWDEKMTELETDEFVRKAEKVYATRLKAVLEPEHINTFVAIEPDSGDYFQGTTLGEAARAARESYPDRLTHAMRIGHRAALHLGMRVR